MVTYVLDSSAVLRYLHNQAGAERVAEIIEGNLAGECEAITPAAHWGEIAGITCKLYGKREMNAVLSRLASLGLQLSQRTGRQPCERRQSSWNWAFLIQIRLPWNLPEENRIERL
jgi:hypothetical protein